MDDMEGKLLVELARQAVEDETAGRNSAAAEVPETLQENRGVFVTLKTYPQDGLRGCIGFPEPVYPLYEALNSAARYACHDPRFPDLRPSEVCSITIEVSVLTVPELIVSDASLRPLQVSVGRDGLIAEKGSRRGLLLPQVAAEMGWNAEEFLSQTCRKAGIAASSWMYEDTAVYKFQAEIFSEISPGGEVRRQEQ